jgi:hypothetical protein
MPTPRFILLERGSALNSSVRPRIGSAGAAAIFSNIFLVRIIESEIVDTIGVIYTFMDCVLQPLEMANNKNS